MWPQLPRPSGTLRVSGSHPSEYRSCASCVHARTVDSKKVRCAELSKINQAIIVRDADSVCGHYTKKET